ncbi:MAG: FecR domain-containing protein [Alphaproteobacteria bacterium]|nr:FecR domain-containing protein [Alphaproteobacteria bacterium]
MNGDCKNNMQPLRLQAAEWVARVYSGSFSEQDEINLKKWREQSELHETEFLEALAVMDDFRDFGISPQDVAQPRHGGIRKSIWAVAAVAAVFMLSFLGITLRDGPEAPSVPLDADKAQLVYSTGVGEQKTVTLGDGSTVALNTASRVYVDFDDQTRWLILDQGEAYFDVAKNSGRPFVVSVGNQAITVLGTKFNVRRSKGEISVAVSEGKVAVHEKLDRQDFVKRITPIFEGSSEAVGGLKHYMLAQGAVGNFSTGENFDGAVAIGNPYQHQIWRENLLSFSGSSLEEVARELSRYSQKPVLVEGEDVRQMLVSGVFRSDELENIWTGLEGLLPVRVEERAGEIVILAAN